MTKKGPESFTVESPEFRSAELKRAYSRLLGVKVINMDDDIDYKIEPHSVSGIDVIQVKNSWAGVTGFLAESIRHGKFIPVVVGDPGTHTKEEIMKSIIENGGWIGDDVDDIKGGKEKALAGLKQVRSQIRELSSVSLEDDDTEKVA